MFACDDSVSMLCARLMRGTSSMAKVLTLLATSFLTMGRFRCGDISAASMAPGFIASASCFPSRRFRPASVTLSTMSALDQRLGGRS